MLALDVGVFLVEVHGVTEEVHDVMEEDPQVLEEWISYLVGLIVTWRIGGSQSGLEPEPRVPWEVVEVTPSDSWLEDSFHVAPRVHVRPVARGRGLAANLQRCGSNEPWVEAGERRGNVDGGWRRCWTDEPRSGAEHCSTYPDDILEEELQNDLCQDHSPWVGETQLEDVEIVLCLAETEVLSGLAEMVAEDLGLVGMARFYHGMETQETDGSETRETPASCLLSDHSGDQPLSCPALEETSLLSAS